MGAFTGAIPPLGLHRVCLVDLRSDRRRDTRSDRRRDPRRDPRSDRRRDFIFMWLDFIYRLVPWNIECIVNNF